MKENCKPFLVGLCLTLLAFASFGKILTFDFTDVDALSLIQTGRVFSWKDLWRILSEDLMSGRMPNATYYRPLLSLFYGLQGRLFNLNPFPYHLVGIFLHLSNAALVYALGRNCLPNRPQWLALLGTFFFLWHPLQVENVPAIARQGDLLVTLFILSGLNLLLLWLKDTSQHRAYFMWSVVFIFLAPFFKEPGIIGAPLLVLTLFVHDRNVARFFKRSLPFVVGAAIFICIRTWALSGVGGYVSAANAPTGWAHFFSWMKANILGHVFGFTLAGFSSETLQHVYLNIRYPLAVWISFWVLLLGSLAFYVIRRRHERVILMCLGFIGLQGVMIYLSFFLFRYLYLSLAPLAVILVWELDRALRERQKLGSLLAGCCVCFLLAPSFWAGPFLNATPYARWKDSGEISRRYLQSLNDQIAQHPNAENVFLVSIPYKQYSRPKTDYFWEIPMTQILLEHAIQDYTTMAFPHRYLRIIGLSHVNIFGDLEKVQSRTKWTQPNQLAISISEEAEITDYPWEKIPGRVSDERLFQLQLDQQGRGNQGRVTLTNNALALPHSLYLAPQEKLTRLAPVGHTQP